MDRLLRNALILLGLAFSCHANTEANRLFREGQRAERAGDKLHAYVLYARAAALDPANAKFLARKDSLAAGMALGAETTLEPDPAEDADIDAQLADAAQLAYDAPDAAPVDLEIANERPALPPPHLQAPPGTKRFDIRDTGQKVFEEAGRAFGIQMLFEANYQDTPAFSFRTGELTMAEAFRTLETMTNSLVVPLNDRLALVIRDNPQRRQETAPFVFASIPIPERISVQDAQEIVTAVQQTLQIKTIAMDPGRHMLFLRDTVSKVIAARQIIADLSRFRGQVEVDIELLAVTKNSSLGIGLTLPNASSIVNFGNFLNNAVSVGTATQFLSFGGGKTLFGLGVTSAQAFATLARSSSDSAFSAQIVGLDGQPATLHVGDRYPIITNAYIGSTAGTTGTVYTPPPTVNFEDLGLALKITPSVHLAGEMTLDIEAEYKVLGSLNSTGIPTISQRKFKGVVRLNAGEWAVIAGLTQESDTHSVGGIAGLANIPLLGRLFRKDTYEKDSTETLLVLKPRLIELPPSEFPTHPLWVGTEGKPISVY